MIQRLHQAPAMPSLWTSRTSSAEILGYTRYVLVSKTVGKLLVTAVWLNDICQRWLWFSTTSSQNFPEVGDIVIYQKASTLVFHKEIDANIDAETLTLKNNGRELEDVFSLPGKSLIYIAWIKFCHQIFLICIWCFLFPILYH